MGWVKTPIKTSASILKEIIAANPKWNGRIGSSSTPYEYWSDFIRDNYDVTLKQCDEICASIKKHFKIKKFYATD